MLSALLLAGLLPFAIMPLFDGAGETGSDEGEEDLTSDAEADGSDDLLDQLTGSEELGSLHRFGPSPGTTELSEFVPGHDVVELDLTTVTGDIYFDLHEADETAAVSVGIGSEQATTLSFPNLDAVPQGDIFLRLADSDSGSTYLMGLAEAMDESAAAEASPLDLQDPQEAGMTDPNTEATSSPVLDPEAPDAADMPGPDVTPDDPAILSPEAPDAADSPGPDVAPEDPAILDPLDPDAPDTPAASAMPPMANVLDPLDPDAPDAPGPDLPPDDPTILDPVDPEQADRAGPDVPPDDPAVLDPLDPDAPDAPGPDVPTADAPQQDAAQAGKPTAERGASYFPTEADLEATRAAPVQQDLAAANQPAGETDIAEGDALSPLAENSDPAGPDDPWEALLSMTEEATTFGTATPEVAGIDDPPTEVHGFRPGTELLEVTLSNTSDAELASELKVAPSEDGLDGLVSLDGELVAILRGAPDATVDDVVVTLVKDAAA